MQVFKFRYDDDVKNYVNQRTNEDKVERYEKYEKLDMEKVISIRNTYGYKIYSTIIRGI